MRRPPIAFALLLAALFAFRLAYGLASEFWFEDELQIYLIGLKSFTTRTWPWMGPDVVYTHTQIPGALQGLLVGLPLSAAPIPEAPTVFLNVLSFASLALLAWYVCRRIPGMPRWLVWTWVMTAPWTLNYGTRVVNPSYVLVFSAPFFVAFLETVLHRNGLIGRRTSFFVMGLATTCVMQLHMSWVLLAPFAAVALGGSSREDRRAGPEAWAPFGAGLLVGASTLIPTLLRDMGGAPSAASNVVFNPGNLGQMPLILGHFLLFAAFDVHHWLGATPTARREVLTDLPWMAPVYGFLFLAGCIQAGLFLAAFFRRHAGSVERKLGWVVLGTVFLTWSAFQFSIKEPEAHTFAVLVPLALFYSFHCYAWLFARRAANLGLLKAAVIVGVLFSAGMGLHNLDHRSLYRDRDRVERAIELRDYTQLGLRRSDLWGYGY